MLKNTDQKKTPYLDSFHAVRDVSRFLHLVGAVAVLSCCLNWCTNILGSTDFGFLFLFRETVVFFVAVLLREKC